MSARAYILPVFVPHLGCPHACVFCDQNRISGTLRPATAEDVKNCIDEKAAFLPKGGKRQLASLLAAAKEALDRGEIDAVRLSTRPDAIDDTVLDRLKHYGVDTVELGAQSMDDAVLRRAGRGHTAADVAQASKMVKAAGFQLILQMMTGLPGATDETDLETAKKIIGLRPDGVRVYPTVIVRGTALCAMWENGGYREHTVEDAVRVCARLLPLFEAAGIPVIRLGLNPTEELSGGAAVAGAYHPALGELVKSRVLLERARVLLQAVAPDSRVTLTVGPGKTSQMAGQHRENIRRLTEEFSLRELKIREEPTANGEIRVTVG